MESEIVARIRVGEVYRLHALKAENGITQDVDYGLFEVLAFADDPIHEREVIVYRCLEGAKKGRWYVCSPWDFAMKFRPEPKPTEPQVEEVTVEVTKVLDLRYKGTEV